MLFREHYGVATSILIDRSILESMLKLPLGTSHIDHLGGGVVGVTGLGVIDWLTTRVWLIIMG